MRLDLFKDILPSLLQNKKNLSEEEEFEQSYNPYIVNKGLSFHLDVILYANMMNQYPHLDKKLQYDFLLHSIRAYKRPFRPWQKRTSIANLETIKEYYNISYEKSKEILNLLTEEQISEMKRELHKGGITK